MHLKRYTDYSLRTLMYLGVHPERIVSINEISGAYSISRNHLLKVVNGLVEHGLIKTYRGKNGGLQLAHSPEDITVGELIRNMEGTLDMINCTEPQCPILPACDLNRVLDEARDAFLNVLDRYTLADLLYKREDVLVRLLATGAR